MFMNSLVYTAKTSEYFGLTMYVLLHPCDDGLGIVKCHRAVVLQKPIKVTQSRQYRWRETNQSGWLNQHCIKRPNPYNLWHNLCRNLGETYIQQWTSERYGHHKVMRWLLRLNYRLVIHFKLYVNNTTRCAFQLKWSLVGIVNTANVV